MRLNTHPTINIHFPQLKWQKYLGLYICIIVLFSSYHGQAQQLSSRHLRDSSVNYALNKGMFSVDFVALNYTVPDKTRYAYYLSGFDKQWTYAGNQRSVSYTNLDPGTYTFHVIASNNNGKWNRVGKKLVISILPPWYMTWWAYASYFAIAITLIYFFIAYRNKKSRYKQMPVQFGKQSEFATSKNSTTPYQESSTAKPKNGNIKTEDVFYVKAPEEASDFDSLITNKQVMLVIDNNDETRNHLREIFHQNYTFHEASSGRKGFEMAKSLLPDIILSYVEMNDIDGVKLCEHFKHDAIINHIPVLLLTESTEAESKLRGLEAGAADVLVTPFDVEILTLRIKSILHDRECMQKHFFDEVTMKSQIKRISENDKDFLYNCEDVIEQHILDPAFELQLIADSLGITYTTLYKKIKFITGQTVNGFVRHVRLRKAAELMIQTNCNVNEAAFNTGFNDIKYFREQFQKQFGTRPSDYIRKHRHSFSSSLVIK